MKSLLILLFAIISIGLVSSGGNRDSNPDFAESACRIEGCPAHTNSDSTRTPERAQADPDRPR